MMHLSTNCPGTNALCKFQDEELSEIDPDFQFHYPSKANEVIDLGDFAENYQFLVQDEI